MARTAKRKTTKRKTTAKKSTARTKRATAKRRPAKRAASRKTTTKRKAAKRTTAHKKTARKKSTNVAAIRASLSKSQILAHISESTELSKKEVALVFEELGELMHRSLKKNSVGEFTVPGLMKCKVVRKPATKARKGINPFTGEPMTFKAKPARNVVKVRPLKKLKEMAQ